jgi:hypothetical protein
METIIEVSYIHLTLTIRGVKPGSVLNIFYCTDVDKVLTAIDT